MASEAAKKVFAQLSGPHKEQLKYYGLGYPDDAPTIDRFTCADCEDVTSCKFAFDAYNTDGDCLAIK